MLFIKHAIERKSCKTLTVQNVQGQRYEFPENFMKCVSKIYNWYRGIIEKKCNIWLSNAKHWKHFYLWYMARLQGVLVTGLTKRSTSADSLSDVLGKHFLHTISPASLSVLSKRCKAQAISFYLYWFSVSDFHSLVII